MTIALSDQCWLHGASPSDLTKIQPRKPTAPSGRRPTVRKSKARLTTRRR
jgi:hypothetical protein